MALPGVLLVLPIVILIGATALLIAGLRGRRVDDHPLCRRCGFDLIGLPEGSIVCSECGADLHRDRSIRTGHRVRRAGMILLSLALLVPSLLWIGIVSYVTAADVNWMSHKPVWLLLRDANTDGAALVELLTRLNNGKLSATNVNNVVAKALAVQADRGRAWNRAWGDFVEQARVAGRAPDVDWARYAQQAVVLDVRARPEVARGDPIWVEVRLKELRVGPSLKPTLMGNETSRKIDDHECGDYGVGGFLFGLNAQTGGSLLRPDAKVMASLPIGPRKLSLVYKIEFSDFHGQRVPPATVQVETSFVLRDPPPPTVEVEANAAALEQIRASTAVTGAAYFASGDVSMRLAMSAPPSFDLAYEVFAVLPDGSERKLLSVAVLRGTDYSNACGGKTGPLPRDVRTIDIVLRPSVDVAHQTLLCTRLCAGEIRVADVPLRRTDEQAPPSRDRLRQHR